jgi:hypothetical protein
MNEETRENNAATDDARKPKRPQDPRSVRTDNPNSRGLPLGGSTGDTDAEGGSRSGSSPDVALSD